MKGLAGLKMLFVIWLLILWACTADGDTSAVSIIDHSMDKPSSSQQFTYDAFNATVTMVSNVSSMAGITSTSSTGCLNDTIAATMLAVPAHQSENGHLAPSVKLSHGACHPRNSTWFSSYGLVLEDELTLSAFEASNASKGSVTEVLNGRAKNNHSASSISSEAFQALPRCGTTSAPTKRQVLSMPTSIRDPTASLSHAASITPRLDPVTPAPATHKSPALIIGVVFGTCGGLFLVILAGLACCCFPDQRRKLVFWRRHEDQGVVIHGIPDCDSDATTLNLAGGASISNASSETLFEAYGVRPGQYPRNVRICDRREHARGYDSSELEDLRVLAGYSTGGYLSAV